MAAIAVAITFSPKTTTTHQFPTRRSLRFSRQSSSSSSIHVQKPISVDFSKVTSAIPVSPADFCRSTPSGIINVESRKEGLKFETLFLKAILCCVIWAPIWFLGLAVCGTAHAAMDSIRASGFGLKVATGLRGFGWPDEAVVFALATLPVIELRGAIPVGYWMQLKPLQLTVLSVLGNMVPVPFIVLYLKKFAAFLAGRNSSASKFLDLLFKRAREKAGPVEEFQWLGLMLFVAVPFPGTGAWTGAIVASVLDMPFWSAMSSNFCGVVLAGLLVNLLVNLGLKHAVVTGIVLFFISTFMWSVLRSVKRSLRSD